MTISTVPDFCRCCRSNSIIVVMAIAAVVVVCLCVVVVVVMAMAAMRGAWNQVVCRVKVTERKFNNFVRLDPAAIVELKPLQMYYLCKNHTVVHCCVYSNILYNFRFISHH